MYQNDSFFQTIGFFMVAIIGMLFITGLGMIANNPDVVTQLHSFNPWLGEHMRWVMAVAGGIVVLFCMIVSFRSMVTDDGKLEKIGFVSYNVVMLVAFCAFIPAVSFLLGVGWLGAKRFTGQ